MSRLLPLTLLVVIGGQSAAQERPLTLEPFSHRRVEAMASGPTMIPLKCDVEGRTYARFYQANVFAAPVVRISADGREVTRFSLPAPEGGDEVEVVDYSSDPHGNLFVLARKGAGWEIVRFASNGQMERREALNLSQHLRLNQLVALDDSRLFITGTAVGAQKGQRAGTPFNAIVYPDGHIAPVALKKDSQPVDSGRMEYSGETNLGVSAGLAVRGDDGNVYVLRQTTPAQVYVISPDGQVRRVITANSPIPKAVARQISANSGRLAIQFNLARDNARDEVLIRTLDTNTGALIQDYALSPDLGIRYSCYTAEGFLFLSTKERTLYLTLAKPQ